MEYVSSTDSDESTRAELSRIQNRGGTSRRKAKREPAKDSKGKPRRRYDKDDEPERTNHIKFRPVSDSDPEADIKYPDEAKIRRHQSAQKDVIKNAPSIHDKRAQQNRRNANFERVDLPLQGEPGHLPGFTRGTRRKKNLKWIEKDRPNDGATLKNFKKGQLLKVKKNMERANASRAIRHYFRAPFLQPRIAVSDKYMQQVALPQLKETKRIRANKDKNREAYTRVDPRRREAYKFIRKLAKILNAMDEYIYPNMGPFPKKPLCEIEYINLMEDDETENIQRNKEQLGEERAWMGSNLPQPDYQPEWDVVSHLHFILNPSSYADRAGDVENFDHTGNFIVVKEEEMTESDNEVKTEKKNTSRPRKKKTKSSAAPSASTVNDTHGTDNDVPGTANDIPAVPK